NIKNKYDKCFLYCIIARYIEIAGKDHPYRTSHYERYLNSFNIQGIKFPISNKDIDKFEKLNNLSINIYGYDLEDNTIYKKRISRLKNDDWRHVDLLYCEYEDRKSTRLNSSHVSISYA